MSDLTPNAIGHRWENGLPLKPLKWTPFDEAYSPTHLYVVERDKESDKYAVRY